MGCACGDKISGKGFQKRKVRITSSLEDKYGIGQVLDVQKNVGILAPYISQFCETPFIGVAKKKIFL